MAPMKNRMSSLEPHLRSLLRIVAAFTFSLHGFQKLFGCFGGLGGATAHFFSMFWLAGALETFGGILIILGLGVLAITYLPQMTTGILRLVGK